MKVFAHRGASAAYAEHTRAAFAHALALGVAGIETDVQLSADGHLICWHDATLDRTSSGTGPVRAYRLAELRGLDVHSWKTLDDATPLTTSAVLGGADEQLVTLDQLTRMMLEADREIELAVEMKIVSPSDGAIEAAVLDWLRRWGWDAATGRLCHNGKSSLVRVSVMSFATEALHYVGQAVGIANLCPLFDQQYQYDLAPATLLGPSVRWLRQPQLLRSWIQAGYRLRMWTVETDEQLEVARQVGIQQVTVNDPVWALQQVGQLV